MDVPRPLRALRGASLLSLLLFSALASAQRVATWGDGNFANVPNGALSNVKAISLGQFHVAALKRDGSVLAWGDNEKGQCDVPYLAQSGVVAVAVQGYHSLALRSDGLVVAWGWNAYGQCNVPASAKSGVSGISAANYMSVAVKEDGSVVAWGYNGFGQCNVPASASSGVIAVSAGSGHVLALKSDGSVIAWGKNQSGECNVPFAAQSDVVAISAGPFYSVALKKNGSVVAWGENGSGQTNVPVAAQSGVVSISAGNSRTIAVKSDGSVVVWGQSGANPVPASLQSGIVGASMGLGDAVVLQAEAWVKPESSWAYPDIETSAKVTLPAPAGPGGVTVGLVADDPTLQMPDSVKVAEGETSATFSLRYPPVFQDRTVTLRTDVNGTATVPYSFTVRGYPVTLTPNRPSVIGGSAVACQMTLDLRPAAPESIAFDLTSSDPTVTVPASVTVGPSGIVDIPVLHSMVPSDRAVKITASYRGETVAVSTVTVKAMEAKFQLGSPKVESGEGTFGILTLNGAVARSLTVPLSSGDPAVTVPPSVKVNAGSRVAYFPISTRPVAQAMSVPISATLGTRTFSNDLKLSPAPALLRLALPKVVYGGNRVTGTVVISRPAPAGGFVVTLDSDASLSVPATVTVPEGATRASFQATATDVSSLTNAAVAATGSLGSATATVEVRPLGVASLALSSPRVRGGESVTGTVTLTVPVATDTLIQLSSDSPYAIVPDTVKIPAGSRSGTFTIATKAATALQTATIIAMKGGSHLSKTLKVQP